MNARVQMPAFVRLASWYLVGLALLVTLVLAVAGWWVRAAAYEAVLQRDAELLQGLALIEANRQAARSPWGVDAIEVAFAASELRDVVGVRVFGPDGLPLADVPQTFSSLTPRVPAIITGPTALFHPQYPLEALFIDEPFENPLRLPMVEVWVPLTETEAAGHILQFWLDGESIAAQLQAIDRRLLWQGGLLTGLAWLLLGGVGGLAIWQLRRQARRLALRQRELEQANRELSFAAKTSAVGAITSHLVHGLKGPLGSLSKALRQVDLPEATPLIQSLQRQLQEVSGMLRQEQTNATITYTLPEIAELATAGFAQSTRAVKLETLCDGEATLTARDGNLVVLILQNLLTNAVEASPEGQTVGLSLTVKAEALQADVMDGGPGLPQDRAAQLFTIGGTSKAEGTGLGLALSAQLARHLGATLRVVRTGSDGTTMRLSLPLTPEANP